ncbi:MAG TPA: efflux RND transporter permease subunit [Spirochaetota bacterium]|nr:efflux RND transporter permease subunit [Spirochaetota bacterium]HOS32676.1 efflux RND transporter permease subunit [Spirochaetota bacterium]HOS56339.1 efflux RND transporter permease subunit [Spirochaetota bacterium]HPK61788.1 efflux RND transporter permease subunit [Spirochaetota bacterium]HQF78298.1 efflux RND transporter permease subunit [Spirochaetota bacterium]
MLQNVFNRRRGILLIVLLGALIGLISLNLLPIKLYPEMRKPWVNVSVPAAGYTAADYRDAYGDTIETALNSIEGVDLVESTYSSGRANFRLEFEWNLDVDEAISRTQTAMDRIKSGLPEESENFSVGVWRSDTSYMSIAIYSTEQIDQKQLYSEVEPILKNKFTAVDEAESVEILNVEELNASITLKPEVLLAYGLSVDNVQTAIRNGYKNVSIGTFYDKRNQYNLRILRGIDSLFDIEKIIIGTYGSKTLYLSDIAEVKVDYGLPSTAFRFNSAKSVLIFVTPKAEGNLKKMSEQIRDVLKKAAPELPSYVKFDYVLDPAEFIDKSINNVINSALLGSLLAFLVIMIMIGEMRNSIIIFISIPLSVVLSFITMKLFNVTINLISLSGMALAVGMIVDASIVVMENIFRHRQEALERAEKKGFIEIITYSVKEVRYSVTSSTLTTVCVFLPLSFTSPLTSGILGDLAKTVVFTLSWSMIVALFIVPLIAYYLFRTKKKSVDEKKSLVKPKKHIFQKFSEFIVNILNKGYVSSLKYVISSKTRSVIFICASFALLTYLIIAVFPKIPKEIIANPKSDRISIRFNNSNITEQVQVSEALEPYEKDIMERYKSDVKNIFTRINRNGRGSVIITLKSTKNSDNILDSMKERYQSIEDWNFDINYWDPASMPLPRVFSLHIKVDGPDRNQIMNIQEKIYDEIQKEKMYQFQFTSPNTRFSEEIILKPRYEILNNFPQYSLSRISSIIRLFLNGGSVVNMSVDNKKMTVDMKFPEDSVKSLSDIENYLVPYDNKSIPIKHFFTFEKTKGINQIRLDNGVETFNIFAAMKKDEPAYKRDKLEERVKEIVKERVEIPEGYYVTFQDTQKVINESVNSLMIAILLSVGLIFIILGFQFNSLRIPLIILVTIPLGFIGVIASLYLFRSTISLNSMLGAILLGGIVVNNAIIIIDFYLNYSKEISSNIEAIIYVAKLRFRPIVITTATTVLGMLPLALALGDGSNIIQPLGIAVSGGLVVSTFFTLYMIPCILSLTNIRGKSPKIYE